MIDIETLVRQNIKTLKPYRSARQDHSSGMLLDANENSFGSVVSFNGLALNRYPDPYQHDLRSRLAELNNVSAHSVFVGVGSDEVIDLLIRIFCDPPGDSVLIIEPTYGMYRVSANIQGISVKSCLLTDDFQIDVDATLGSLSPSSKMIFCCSPNNPTGNLLRLKDIVALCERSSAIVVVDEAYVDFAQAISLGSLIGSFSNLVVLRTLSKAWGLAGIRLGYCIANPVVISYLMKIKPPYNINALTSSVALQALHNAETAVKTTREIISEREFLSRSLSRLPLVRRVFPSDANFLLVRTADAKSVYEHLARRGIIVRDRSSEPKLDNCLRITVGTRAQNEALLNVLKEISS